MGFDNPLPERWKWMRLAELADPNCRAIVSGPFGSNISSKFFVDDGIPVIRGNNLTTGAQKFVDQGFVFVTPEKAKELGNVDAIQDDIIFTAAGSLGQVGIIPQHSRYPLYIISNKQMRVRLNRKVVDPLFVFQWLSSAAMVSHIQQQNTGSSVPLINLSIIRGLDVPVPPLAEQRAIANILGVLDDKIELNRRMNETLEGLARAIFQSWFVDFDPIRANCEERRVKSENSEFHPSPFTLPPSVAALFPGSFQDSPIGHIPKGWEVSTIGAKLSTALGGTPSRANPDYWTEGTVPWINSGKTNEFRIIEPSEWITREALANSATKLLPKRTTVLAITGATLGQVSITEIECCANQSVVAILASNEFPTEFIYPWIEENIEKLVASQTGGAQQHINKGNVEELVLLCPDQRVVREYVNKTKPLFDQIAANCFQSRTLATLRDTLLPKLLSGELAVSGPIEASA